uniref:Uncharacterized protein n=1 Tax=Ciona savignyi TaxID=51511 RepID=H2Z504_CIOSA
DQLDTEVERSVEQFETSTENVDEKAESTVKNIDGHVETVDEDVEIVETLVENNSEEEECFKQSQEDIFKDDNDDDETDIEDDFVNNQEQCVFEDPYLAETQVISPIGAENCPGNTGEKILGITDNSGKDWTKDDDDISRDDINITCGDDESIQKCAEGLVDSDLESDNDVSLLPNTNMIDTQHQHMPQMSGGILSMSCPKDNMENMNKCETVQDKINDVEHELEKDSKTISDK